MHTIEFEADIQNGVIKIPDQYKDLNSKHVKIIAFLNDSQMLTLPEKIQNKENRQFSHEYINSNWRKLIITYSTDPLQDDNKILQEEYGDYLSEKHSS